jgi:hypothetical protein
MPPATTAASSSGQPAWPADRAAAPARAIGLPLGIAFVGVATMGFNTIGIGFLPLSDLVFFALASVIGVLSLTGSDRTVTPAGSRGTSPRILVASVVIVTMGVSRASARSRRRPRSRSSSGSATSPCCGSEYSAASPSIGAASASSSWAGGSR